MLHRRWRDRSQDQCPNMPMRMDLRSVSPCCTEDGETGRKTNAQICPCEWTCDRSPHAAPKMERPIARPMPKYAHANGLAIGLPMLHRRWRDRSQDQCPNMPMRMDLRSVSPCCTED